MIIEPAQNEKDRAIEHILDKGLRKPRGMWSAFREIHRLIGYRFVFWDTAGALVLSAITLALASLAIPLFPPELRHTALFGCSPLLFVAVTFFFETMERAEGIYELKQTCKHAARQVSAFRIMCFSLLGAVFCVGVAAYQADGAYELLRLVPLSLCALSLCAFISLFLILRVAGKRAYALASALWAAVAVAPAVILGDKWEALLSGLPVAATAGATALFGALFLHEIKKTMNARREGVSIYAVG